MVELLLWFFFCLPGLIYSIWRLSAHFEHCRHCGGNSCVPLDSPRGYQLYIHYYPGHQLPR